MLRAKQPRFLVHVAHRAEITTDDLELGILPDIILSHFEHAEVQIGDWTEGTTTDEHDRRFLGVLQDCLKTVVGERVIWWVCEGLCEMDWHCERDKGLDWVINKTGSCTDRDDEAIPSHDGKSHLYHSVISAEPTPLCTLPLAEVISLFSITSHPAMHFINTCTIKKVFLQPG